MMSFELMRSEAPSHEDMNTPTRKMNVMDVINPSPNILIPRWVIIDWGEEMNEPPCEVECDSDWKKNHTIVQESGNQSHLK
ncbi:hypothetical protein F2Q70_00001005 [Brassica cretica]|nr:hypothetical protein F2Q70_00001005 [Brassica cretica]